MMKLFVSLFCFLIVGQVFAQKNHDEIIRDFLQQRKKMMEEVFRAFEDDSFFKDFDKDFFDEEETFKQFKKGGLGGIPQFKSQGPTVFIEEQMESDGSINIFIKPASDKVKLDIETTKSNIIIKGETVIEEVNDDKTSQTQSQFKSSFARTINIPDGFRALSPLEDHGRIKIKLVQKNNDYFKSNSNGKTPIAKPSGEETI